MSTDSRSAGLHTLRAQRTRLLAPAVPFPHPLTRTQAKITSETRPETREGLTQDSLPSGGRREGRALRKPLGPGDRGAADPAGPPGLQEDPLRVSGRGCRALPLAPCSGLGASADPRTGLAEPRAFSAGEQKCVRSRGAGGSSPLAPSSARTRPRRHTRSSRSTSSSALLLQSSRGGYVWTKEHICTRVCESVYTRVRERARPCAPGAEGGAALILKKPRGLASRTPVGYRQSPPAAPCNYTL